MASQIAPGTMVTLKITRTPNSERAAKTLSRLFAKDTEIKKQARRRHRILEQTTDPRRRGGRLWNVKNHAPRISQPQRGDSCRILATVDVIDDLGSVGRFIEVSAGGK